MALKSTICSILHHARQTRAHCPTMVLNSHQGQYAYPGFIAELVKYTKNLRVFGFRHMHCCTDTSDIVHQARQT